MSAIPLYARGQKDTGVIRKGRANEDNFYDGRLTDDEKAAVKGRLYIVADGIGGSKGGRRASEIATTHLPNYYYDSEGTEVVPTLSAAIMRTAQDILTEAQNNPELSYMGCTLVATVIRDGKAVVAYLGDARVYLLRANATIQQLTVDHSWVQEQVSRGVLTPEEARVHPNRNVITKSLGSPRLPEPSIVGPFELAAGDQMLLCSDGLCGVVPDEVLTAELQKPISVADKVQNLIDQANASGGPDNISVVVVHAGEPTVTAPAAAAMPAQPVAAGKSRGLASRWMIFAFVAIVAVTAGAALYNLGLFGGGDGPDVVAEVEETAVSELAAAPNPTEEPTATVPLSVEIEVRETEVVAADAPTEESQTATPVPNATSTLGPTQTPTPTRTPRPTVAPTFPPVQPELPIIDPSLRLESPVDCDSGGGFTTNQNVTFRWTWPETLATGQYLEIRVRGASQGRINGDAQDGDEWEAMIPVSQLGEAGEVRWRVHLMEQTDDGPVELAFSSNTGCMRITTGGGGNNPPGDEPGPGAPEPVPTNPPPSDT